MTVPARRLRAVPSTRCDACDQPMTVVNGHRTHPCCDPVYGWWPPARRGTRQAAGQTHLRIGGPRRE